MTTPPNGFAATPFLDLSARVSFEFGTEDGLLNLVFPANFAASQKFYVYYTRTGDLASVLSRFSVSTTNASVADPNSEEQILVIPEVTYRTLNGGMLAFGPDGFLYLGTGDNGYYFDEESLAQKTDSLWGKILRLDVNSVPHGYAVPPGNPFVGLPGRAPEIWALGFRNPYRFSFDRTTGDLYISDVGQFIAEEINHQPAGSPGGRNYGWREREGRHPFFSSFGGSQNFVEPIWEVTHGAVNQLRAINGGYVYRGPDRPRLNGMYFFGDFYNGQIDGLIRSNGVWVSAPVAKTGFFLSSFGEDQAGNLYVTDYISGGLYRLDDSQLAKAPCSTRPARPVL